ncbi:MAG: hypothetical protein ACYTGO_00815 [Planctomycetota bacterium]|jgi:hypothetical protein
MTTSTWSDHAWQLLAIAVAGGIGLGPGQPRLCAQGVPASLVVPARYATQEAPNAVFWAVSPFAARRQLLFDAAHLAAANGHKLKGLWVRRNGGDRDTLPAGFLHVAMSLSETARRAASASAAFASNRGKNPVQVFAGAVKLPQSPPPKVTPAAWAQPFAVRLPFQTTYAYGGSNLCLETVTSPMTAPDGAETQYPWWPLDGLRQSSLGKVTVYGHSCIPKLSGYPAGADAASQNLGASAVVFLRGGRPRGNGLLLFGIDNNSFGGSRLPLDLAGFGAPGCSLYLDPLALARITLTEQPGGQGHVAAAVPVPYDVRLAGMSYYTQWVLQEPPGYNPLGLTLSNGVQATIGPYVPPLGISWIESTDPNGGTGRILAGRTPVLRFDL